MTNVEQFQEAIRAAGLEPPEVIEEDGRLHRFPTNGRRGDDAGWYKLSEDGRGGVFGDFRTGLSETWQTKRDKSSTAAEREAFRQRCEKEGNERKAEQMRRYDEASRIAVEILRSATGDPALHPYAVKKSVPLGRLVRRGAWAQRGWSDALLVPIYGTEGTVWTVEAINGDGEKDFLGGGKKQGGFYPFGKIRNARRVLIGEGIATVAAGVAAAGAPAVAAMDCGNLESVAYAVKKIAPNAELVLLADNDIKADGDNPGIQAATAAARAVGARIAVPEMEGRKCDFWDLWHERGAETVVRAIAAPRAWQITNDAQSCRYHVKRWTVAGGK